MRWLPLAFLSFVAAAVSCGSSSNGGGNGGAGGDSTSTSIHGSSSTHMTDGGGCEGEGEPCYGGDPLSENIGACKDGKIVCVGGAPVCQGAIVPAAEACDGVDNNCNGMIDEGCTCVDGNTQACWSGDPTQRGVGACKDGTQTCVNGKWTATCDGQTLPSAETCNGIDDDCDGKIDNGDPGSGGVCDTGFGGACAPGIQHCSGAQLICSPNAQGSPCDTGQAGVCGPGTIDCSGGSTVCNRNQGPSAETCDGVDNDCNGVVDDSVGSACDTGLLGQCEAGTIACGPSGTFVCNQNQGATGEVCDGIDNDCDGIVDDNACCFCECCGF